MAASPSGTVTFLFTDIEGSTELARRLGARWSTTLGLHRDLLRAAFATHGGQEIGTEGDSFFVVFPSASAAVSAAADAQRALAAAAWPEGTTLRVRMGLHTGEAAIAGGGYEGLEVHRAARIAAAAHGGQVVVSAATIGVLGERMPKGLRVVELGSHRLKDFADQESLYQLVIEGLPSEFPPLRSLSSRRANLPTQLTTFVGRKRDVTALGDLLADARLVTLTGPGGTGKTRLAIEVAGGLVEQFEDGASFVPLAPVGEASHVPPAIAQVLGLLEAGDRPLETTIREWLADKHLLLVLDNFEHLMAAAPQVSGLLADAPRLHVLATSRELLRLGGERNYPVSPLGLPEPDGPLLPAELLAVDAVNLFVERARAVRPGFELDQENAAAVVAICRRLDGLPLAIELAAARLRILSPQALLDRLETSLDLLSGGDRDLPSRQQTLRATIEWSERLLEESERRLFRRLSVFRGGWTIEAAGAVVAGATGDPAQTPLAEVLDGLSSLADKSLIRPLTTSRGEPRFLMLETIREYGIERLTAEGELEDARAAHARSFGRLAAEAEAQVERPEAPEWLDRLDRESGNLAAALEWSTVHDRAMAMDMGAQLWRYWQRRGRLGEGRSWLERIVALPAGPDLLRQRARALGALGSVAYWQNDYPRTAAAYAESLAIWRRTGDDAGIAEALYNFGFMGLIEHRFDDARAAYAESLALAERLGDRKGMGRVAFGLGMVAMISGDLPEARRRFEESIAVLRAAGDDYLAVSARRNLVEVAIRSGELGPARELNREVLRDAYEVRDPTQFAGALKDLATIELAEGNVARALRLEGATAAVEERAGGRAPAPLVTAADVRAEAVGRLPAGEIERYWEEGRALDDDAAYLLAVAEDEGGI